MKFWMVFRAQTPPNFNFADYRSRSSEPIRFDTVTVVQAETASEAIEALIGSTGMIVTGFAACEVHVQTYDADTQLGKGGILVAESARKLKRGSDGDE